MLIRILARILEPLLWLLWPPEGQHRAPRRKAQQTQQTQRAECSRRRALWLVAHGVDVGPRHTHGVAVRTP